MDLKFGIVEDIMDPEETGRVRVRVYGIHSEKLAEVPSDCLPWAQCMSGSYDSTLGGKGKTPTGINVGQLVVVTFLDSLMQIPLVLGSLAGINSTVLNKVLGSEVSRNNSTYGFQQPIDETYIGKPDTNFQARTEEINPIHDQRLSSRETEINAVDESWNEPASTMDLSQYPNSKVYETNSGHLQEFDDTEGNERILLWHKSGTMYELANEFRLAKVEGSDFQIIKEDKNLKIGGNLNITVDGDANIDVKGKTTIKSPEIELGTDQPEPMVLGDKLADWIMNELKVWLDTHTHTGNLGAPTSPPMMPFQTGTAMKGNVVYSVKNKTQK